MNSAEFDFVAGIHERLVDKALASAFYFGLIPNSVNKTISFASKVPNQLKSFAGVDISVHLKEPPTVDLVLVTKIRLLANIEVVLKALGGIRFEFDVKASAEVAPTLDTAANTLHIDLSKALLTRFTLNDRFNLPAKLIKQLNKIAAEAVKTDLFDKAELIDLSDLIKPQSLPYMDDLPQNKLPVSLRNFDLLNNKVLSAAVNFNNYTGGVPSQITNFNGDHDFAAAVSEAGMHRVFDFWWDHTNWSKSYTIEGKKDFPDAVETIAQGLADIGLFALDVLTLGVVDKEVKSMDFWLKYKVDILFSKPSFNLKPGNELSVGSMDVHVDVFASLCSKVVIETTIDRSGWFPDWLTPGEDDTTTTQTYETELTAINTHLIVKVENVTGQVYLDDEHHIMGKLTDLDLTIDLTWSVPEVILNFLLDFVEKMVVKYVPPITLSPSIIAKKLMGLTLEADITAFTVTEDEAVVTANLTVKELGKSIAPVPLFIANRDPLSLEVHREDCQWVAEIWQKNRVGYYVLLDAFNDGYDGCKYCLPEYHSR